MKIYQILIAGYLEQFHQKGEEIIKAICGCDIPSEAVLSQYHKFTPIEQMDEKEKRELKQYVLETFPGKSVEEQARVAKVIYTFGNLI